jgi:FMN reductase
MRIAVVTAGLSTPSSTRVLADAVATATRGRFSGAGAAVQVEVIELRELAHALVDALLTGCRSSALEKAIDEVTAADGLIAVTPIFNASYSALFKAFFDVLDIGALAGKPVLIAATGGTERHSLALEHALRPLFAYLGAYVAPTAVYAAPGDLGAGGGGMSGLAARAERAAEEFALLVTSVGHRPTAGYDEGPVPFEQVLAGQREG